MTPPRLTPTPPTPQTDSSTKDESRSKQRNSKRHRFVHIPPFLFVTHWFVIIMGKSTNHLQNINCYMYFVCDVTCPLNSSRYFLIIGTCQQTNNCSCCFYFRLSCTCRCRSIYHLIYSVFSSIQGSKSVARMV